MDYIGHLIAHILVLPRFSVLNEACYRGDFLELDHIRSCRTRFIKNDKIFRFEEIKNVWV